MTDDQLQAILKELRRIYFTIAIGIGLVVGYTIAAGWLTPLFNRLFP